MLFEKDIHKKFIYKAMGINKRDCIEWKFTVTKDGYGTITVPDDPGKSKRVHRVSYEAFHGTIPEGYKIDHMCMNKKCFNPYHIRAVDEITSALENSSSPSARNMNKKRCKRGHPFNEENTIHLEYFNKKVGKMRKFRNCRMCQTLNGREKYIRRLARLNQK